MTEPPHRVHHITESRVNELIEGSLARRDLLHRDELRTVIATTVRETLIQIGVQPDSPADMQKDFATLRTWRKFWETATHHVAIAILGMSVIFLVGAAALGVMIKIRGG